MTDLFRFLRSVPYFKGLSDEEIRTLQQACQPAEHGAGETVFEEGSRANRFYIILEGAVEVWKDHRSADRSLLAVFGAGQFFGEMALIDEMPRSATIISREPTRLYYINQDDFNRIVQENGRIALAISRAVSAIVRENTNRFLDGLRRRNRELEEANRELRETQEELLRADRLSTLGKMSSLILHDIRNPLSVLRSLAEMIILNSSDRERTERNAQRIIQTVGDLDRLAGELLDYSRGEIRLNMSIVDLKPFFGRLVESIAERFQARGIAVELEIEFAGPVILDEARMMRVFLNLADNAYKAMPEGGRFSIRVSRSDRSNAGGGELPFGNRVLVGSNKVLVIEVNDTGIGMTPEVQKRVFEPFFSRSTEGGTGLGMTIVQNVIRAHQGDLSVRSRRFQGTSIRIVLPLFE